MQLPPRLESLLLKSGVHLGVLSDGDRALVLALAAWAMGPGRSLREDEVNRRLIDWLADVGQMLNIDDVEAQALSRRYGIRRPRRLGTCPTCAVRLSLSGVASCSGPRTPRRWLLPSARCGSPSNPRA
jgi:hypothetical protein